MENIPYPVVPFTGAMTSVFDIEDYKALAKSKIWLLIASLDQLKVSPLILEVFFLINFSKFVIFVYF